jgi:uncharacterized protein
MDAGYCVFDRTNGCFLALHVTPALSAPARIKGLLGKVRIAPGEGLWFAPSRWIHTIGMLFPVDVLFLNADNRVIHMIENMAPFRVSPSRLNSASVLALTAHTIYASRVRVGDEVIICRPEELADNAGRDAGSAVRQKISQQKGVAA